MRSGQLQHRITIQERSETQDRFGGNKPLFTDLKGWWAAIEPLQGREFFSNQQMGGETTHRIRIRYCPFITIKHRIKYKTRYFDIENIIDLKERNEEMHLMCKEVSA